MGDDDETRELGPAEQACNDELERLGFSPLTAPGPLRTAAVRALLLAETLDRSQNAAALPGLDRRLSDVMAEARQAAQPDVVQDPDAADDEVVDFEERRRRRDQQ
jgi:hypothetical protein